MTKLAIKGHATRGREVIEILKMLGGKVYIEEIYKGEYSDRYYFINKNDDFINSYFSETVDMINDFQTFTLEEFLEKFPYKIGDKVQHKNATSCGSVFVVEKLLWEDNQVKYILNRLWYNNDKVKMTSEELQPYK